MTDHSDSNEPADNPSPPTGSQPPISTTPSTPPQNEIHTNANDGTHHDKGTAQELAREFRWVEFGQLIVNGGLAVIGIFALCIYHGQLDAMNKTYKEIVNQTYDACLNAQAAQETLLQVQRSASDSRAVTVATIKQTTAGLEAERAFISVKPRFPTKDELFNQQLVIPFSLSNSGKSAALNADLKSNAVLFGEGDDFKVNGYKLDHLSSRISPPNSEFPGKPESPEHKAFTLSEIVRDTKGNVVSVSSKEAQDFLGGVAGIVVFFGRITYSDFTGNHKVRFCDPVYIGNPGTSHKMGKIEAGCAKYNHQDDQYTAMPDVNSLPPMGTAKINPINCTKPSN